MRSDFEAWINGLTDDDGSGTVGDIVNKSFFNTQMGLIDDAINTTGGLITTDTTYYVATTGSDTTGDGSITMPWATPAKALSELGNYRVQEGKTVTIQCDDGTYSFTSPIINLPKGFLLTGKNIHTKTMTSVQSSTGSARSWAVVVNLDNVTNITTSDYAIFSAASGGTLPKYIEGVWNITNVDAVNSRITVATTHAGVSAPSSTVTATVTIIKTVFSFVGVSGISLTRYIGGQVSKCVLKGDNTAATDGISLIQAACECVAPLGIVNFGRYGVAANRWSSIALLSCAVSSNGSIGIYCISSVVSGRSAIVAGNASYGMYSAFSGNNNFELATISGNASYGVVSEQQSSTQALSANISGNTTYDVYAQKYGYIHAASATIAGSTSPAVNTQGNEYGYIDT